MTALSLVFPVQNFINAAGIGFGVGINAVIAFYSGAGDKERADRAATLGVLLAAEIPGAQTSQPVCSRRNAAPATWSAWECVRNSFFSSQPWDLTCSRTPAAMSREPASIMQTSRPE